MIKTELPEAYRVLVEGILKVSFPNGLPWMGIDNPALGTYIARFISVELPDYDHHQTTMGCVVPSFLKWIETEGRLIS